MNSCVSVFAWLALSVSTMGGSELTSTCEDIPDNLSRKSKTSVCPTVKTTLVATSV